MSLAAVPLLASFPAGAREVAADGSRRMPPDASNAFSCTDVSNLTEAQVKTRKAVQYVDASPHAEKRCGNCRFFVPPEGDAECGRCEVVPGPIHPKGYCTAWVALSR